MPFVTAEPHVEKNATYGTGASFTFTEETYTLTVGTVNTTSLLLKGNNKTIILDEEDCKRFGPEILCYESKINSQVRLVTYDLRADVEITFEINQTTKLTVGDIIEGSVAFNNSGERDTEEFIMLFSLPENITITEYDTCELNSTYLYYNENIRSDKEENCTFTIRIDGEVEDTILKSNLTYTTFAEVNTDESQEETITASLPFEYAIYASSLMSLEPAEIFYISVFINNTLDDDENLTIEPLVISGPDLLFISSDHSRVRGRGNEATLDDRLTVNETINVTSRFEVPYYNREGKITISFTYNTTEDAQQRTFERTVLFNTTTLPIQITTKDALQLESAQQKTLEVTIANPYHYLPFKGYHIEAISPLLIKDVSLREAYSPTLNLVLQLEAPQITTQRTENIMIVVTAKTDSGQTIREEKIFVVDVMPVQSVSIDKTAQTTEEAILITVVATNNHYEPINITLEENIPQGFFVKGETTTTIELLPQVQQAVYTYQLIPDDNLQAPAKIITTINYLYQEELHEESTTLTLKEDQLSIKTTTPPEPVNVTIQPPQQNITEEPPLPISDDRLYWILVGAALFLFVLATIFATGLAQDLYIFKFRHKTIVKNYQTLLDNGKLLRKRKEELDEEHKLLFRQTDLLKKHLAEVERLLPLELDKLEKINAIAHKGEDAYNAKIFEAEEQLKVLQEQLSSLQQKKNELLTDQHNLANAQEKLKKDKAGLDNDLLDLKNTQIHIEQEQESVSKHQQLLVTRIAEFKSKHKKSLNSKMKFLAKRRAQARDFHQQLEAEESYLKEEFERLDRDIKNAEKDLQGAEKVFKEPHNHE